MTLHVNVPLSNELFERAQKMAPQLNKEMPQFLADHLAETLVETTNEKDIAIERERAAYHALHPILLEQHPGDYVAIYEGELVDFDQDQLALVGRLDKDYPDQFVLVRQVTTDPEPEYRRISIRWAE